MKLQKLVFYSQAWSLVWNSEPLFQEPIEAWPNGPAVRALYDSHRGRFEVCAGDLAVAVDALNREQRETVDAVVQRYGAMSVHALSELARSEPPWWTARKGLAADEHGDEEISHASMVEYYSSLPSSLRSFASSVRPVDVLVLAQLIDGPTAPSDVHAESLARLRGAGLVVGDRVAGSRTLEFIEHAVKYIVPNEQGVDVVSGIVTSVFVEPMASQFSADGAVPLVWAHPHGEVRGYPILPLVPEVPYWAERSQSLHQLLAAIDVFRVGHARERRVARDYLVHRLATIGAFARVA
jgi:uncharacterized phage-associated protein